MDFEYDYHGMGRYLRGSTDLERAMTREGQAVAARARVLAQAEAYETGDYSRAFEVTAERGEDGRVGAVVTNTDPVAAAVEFGNSRNGYRGRHILARAAVAG